MSNRKKWTVVLSPQHPPTKHLTIWCVSSDVSSAYVSRIDEPPPRAEIAKEIRMTVGRGLPKSVVDQQVSEILADYAQAGYPQWCCTAHNWDDCYHIKAVQREVG